MCTYLFETFKINPVPPLSNMVELSMNRLHAEGLCLTTSTSGERVSSDMKSANAYILIVTLGTYRILNFLNSIDHLNIHLET